MCPVTRHRRANAAERGSKPEPTTAIAKVIGVEERGSARRTAIGTHDVSSTQYCFRRSLRCAQPPAVAIEKVGGKGTRHSHTIG